MRHFLCGRVADPKRCYSPSSWSDAALPPSAASRSGTIVSLRQPKNVHSSGRACGSTPPENK